MRAWEVRHAFVYAGQRAAKQAIPASRRADRIRPLVSRAHGPDRRRRSLYLARSTARRRTRRWRCGDSQPRLAVTLPDGSQLAAGATNGADAAAAGRLRPHDARYRPDPERRPRSVNVRRCKPSRSRWHPKVGSSSLRRRWDECPRPTRWPSGSRRCSPCSVRPLAAPSFIPTRPGRWWSWSAWIVAWCIMRRDENWEVSPIILPRAAATGSSACACCVQVQAERRTFFQSFDATEGQSLMGLEALVASPSFRRARRRSSASSMAPATCAVCRGTQQGIEPLEAAVRAVLGRRGKCGPGPDGARSRGGPRPRPVRAVLFARTGPCAGVRSGSTGGERARADAPVYRSPRLLQDFRADRRGRNLLTCSPTFSTGLPIRSWITAGW